jgi:Fe(3+) dicitrate transport protein
MTFDQISSKKRLFFVLYVCVASLASSQNADSLETMGLPEISIKFVRENIAKLPKTDNGFLWSGKKNEVVNLQNLDANIAEKNPRQIFATVPGVFVYDMDGSGNQTNISTRGLDPHRGWEFNIRTNGVLTNTDMYGYPASHFSLPMEAVASIELVRGTGALQYGGQFGGMLNYRLRQADTTRAFSLESINAAGSFGLTSTFNAIGGKLNKIRYYAYYSRRVSDGYRENGKSDYNGEGIVLDYFASPKFSLNATLLRSKYVYQLPGQLTDAMFLESPRQATRSRNYYSPEIWLPSITANWKIAQQTSLRWTVSATLGQRGSVMFDRLANVPDTIVSGAGTYNQRQVDIDNYHSRNTELKLLHQYRLWGQTNVLSAGIQYFNNNLHRRQQGKGSTGSDYDLNIDTSGWGRDMRLKSKNIAFSLENRFQISKKLSLSPGIRYELGESVLTARTAYYNPAFWPDKITHNFPLLGLNGEFVTGTEQMLYGGWSQAYRPVIFKDMVPGSLYEQSDKDLKDAYGYNMELGWRGKTSSWTWDVSAFSLLYNNRLGSVARYNASIDTFVLYRTNIGDSRTNGLEIFLEYKFDISDYWHVNVFTATAFFDAKYLGDSLRVTSTENRSLKGKKLESVPVCISRNGLNIRYDQWSASFLYSYTGSTFSDPLNTELPSANGAVGKVPGYGLLDFNTTFRMKNLTFRLSLSNILDKQYFTKRPTFYPGPGIWPSDGRSMAFSVAVKI